MALGEGLYCFGAELAAFMRQLMGEDQLWFPIQNLFGPEVLFLNIDCLRSIKLTRIRRDYLGEGGEKK